MIQRRLGKLRVLVVIDDVDQVAQLECLAGNHDWFGPGSRIIITSADVHLLNCVDTLYEAAVLTHDEALQLLSLKAFKKNPPPEVYLELCNNILGYAHGLPLVLVVIGPFLCGRSINEWKSAIDRLRNKPETSIVDVLQISFDGLRETEKEIFLHVACFYVGKDRDRVSEILDYCQLYPDIGLSVLADKSLITISNNKLSMHALLQEMGWEIVRRESPKPGRRTRLWSHEDIHNVLKKNKGTEAVQGMVMDLPKLEVANWNPEAFSKLSELNFLQIRNVDLPNGLTCLSNSLRLLEWSEYPLRSLPQNFEADELIELNLCHSKIEHLWEGTKCFDKLKFIKLCHSQNIVQTPDLTGACSLECLDLEGCKNLVKIHQSHQSVGVLKKLIVLNLKNCESLQSLPDRIEMESLKTLILSGCSNIKKIPEFSRNMECLSELCLDRTAIEKLPDSIQYLCGLSFLDLSNCKNLFCLPSTINRLTSLKNINLSGCQKLRGPDKSVWELDFLPANVASITPVTELPSSVFSISDHVKDSSSHGYEVIQESLFEFLPSGLMQMAYEEPTSFRLSLSGLGNLTDLNISDCNLDDRAFVNNFGWLPCLVALNLSGNDFIKLPPTIRRLNKLENVNLENCKRLEDLSNLPSNSKLDVRADGCSSLRILFDITNYNRLEESYFSFINCFKLNEDRGHSNIAFEMLKIVLHQAISTTKETFQIVFPGSEIPRWFKHQSRKDSLGVCILPPRPYSSRFMGFALCAVFVINDERHQVDELEIHHFKTFKATHNLVCYLKLNGKELEVCGRQPAFRFSEEFCQVESDHRWVFYVSSDKYFGIEEHDRCSQIELLFEARGPGLKVKACGLRLIFEQDVHELMKGCRHTQAYGRHGYVRRYECDCWVDGYLYSI
ncbi:putative P-loop containing nucleoside triphosphate hydrolase, leucine-rich repeat domain, L [Rosa chinensis]|uniref:Putative P-loop containing nucleoside triphosphate hydrolase, leucine-rich repeat domain, L n=2 Tax=Rosa chinensis TaxID=74649 RepID=A0A2P6PKM5_ROSCH|nr:putative P-loop containing nucleoside triphosphate hydrolase, leucine-rich repeat domain, L [Rosa chinensis]